jgi:hypothetical protein
VAMCQSLFISPKPVELAGHLLEACRNRAFRLRIARSCRLPLQSKVEGGALLT